MFIKIRTPDGAWDIREAKAIKYSQFRHSVYKDDPIAKNNPLMEFSWGSYPESLNEELRKYYTEKKIVYSDYVKPATCGVLGVPQPAERTFAYAVLDDELSIIFTTEAYIINDSGKTIAKVSN